MSWQKDYLDRENWTNAFGVQGPAYDAEGHRGTDYRDKDRPLSPLLAWEELECINMGYHPIVGPYVNFRARDGVAVGVAHVKEGTRPDIGQKVKPGGTLALPAGYGDRHGSAWFGPHFHIVGSRRGPNAAQGFRNEGGLFDMKPRILLAAGQKPTPIPAPAGGVRTPALVAGQVTSWRRANGLPGAPWVPVGPLMARIQGGLRNRGRYRGPIDGIAGGNTYRGIQITLNNARLNGRTGYRPTSVDGALQVNNAYGVQRYAAKWGGYRGPIDADPHYLSWLGFAKGINP